MKEHFYIGVDVGGTKISAGLVDNAGQLLFRKKYPTPQGAKAGEVYDQMAKLLNKVMDQAKEQAKTVRGIGIGVPGIVSADRKKVLVTPNINLSNYPLGSKIGKHFQVETVLGNDVNLGLLAAKWLGVAKEADNIIGLFIGTGVGGSIIIEDKLYTGSQGAGGELGHMIIDKSSKESNAGVVGSLEALASRKAIERKIRKKVERGEKTILKKLNDGALTQIKSKVLAEALSQKDKVVIEVIDDVCEVLGKACISLRHVFNPDMIVFGGGVIEACGDYMLPKIKKISQKDPFFKGIDDCQIVPSHLGDDAGILGAVALVKEEMHDPALLRMKDYPQIRISDTKGLVVKDKRYKRSVYIRADGKIKKFKDKSDERELLETKKIGTEHLNKFCKQNPEVFVIGVSGQELQITKEGKALLKTESIEYKILPIAEAVALYNGLNRRKAILILQNTQSKS